MTKLVTDSNQKLHELIKFNTKAIDGMNESNIHVKDLELMKKNGVIHSSLIRPLAKLLVPTNKRHFRLFDDRDSEKWNDYKMNGEKVTIYDDKLVFKKVVKFSP